MLLSFNEIDHRIANLILKKQVLCHLKPEMSEERFKFPL